MATVKVKNKCVYWVRASVNINGPWSVWGTCSLEQYQAVGDCGGCSGSMFFQRFKSDTGVNPNGQKASS